MGGTNKTETTQQSSQSAPWAPSMSTLGGILGQLNGALGNAQLTGTETNALNQMAANASAGNPYAAGIAGVAGNLLAGGGADRSGIVNNAYATLQSQLSPYAGGANLNPYSTPGFGDALGTLNGDITNQINGQFAGAGRDLSGMNVQALARGLAQGEGGLIQSQYNQNVANQLSAANALYGAGSGTAQQLAGLDQARLANQQAGIGAAQSALAAQNYGPQMQLAVEAQRRGIPLQSLQQIAGIADPIAGLGKESEGTSTQTTSTPFNPWSLAPLAFAPLTGGTSLAGMGTGALGSGLFGAFGAGSGGPGSGPRVGPFPW
jgi:hypothetical protein